MKKFLTILLLTLISIFSVTPGALAENDRVVEKEGSIPVPVTYGNLNQPEDLFLDRKGFLYVADTANNRVLKMDTDGKVLESIAGPADKPYNKPKGIFVDEDGALYVADSGNKRVIRRSVSGEYDKVYVKPKSSLLSADFVFDPQKIYRNSTGILYVSKGISFITIDDANQFQGYVGAKEVGFDLRRMFIRLFASRSQRDRIAKVLPVSYNNFVIGPDGFVYATVGNAQSGQIRKINAVGKNLYPDQTFGERMMGENGEWIQPSLADIAVDERGIISTIDKATESIYQYDQEGNMLLAFGDKGEKRGGFLSPSSIVTDEKGNLYISDSKANNIQIFEPTNFTRSVHQAVSFYNNGDYKNAMDYWQQVLAIDANYSLAHKGMGKLYYKEERWKDSMDEYLLAEDKGGYSRAFREYRHQKFRQYFAVVFFAFIGIVVGFYFLFLRLKEKSGKIVRELF